MKKYDKERLIEILEPYNNENILLLLQVIQENFSFISNEHIIYLSEKTKVPCSQIESILSFYKFFNREKVNYNIRICQTISCDLKNKDKIVKAFENELNIKMGERTSDNYFQLSYCSCMGMCDRGPAILINERLISKVNPYDIPKIIDACKNNKLYEAYPETIVSNIYYEDKLVGENFGKAIDYALKLSPSEIIEKLKEINLRGRGGAGFPTWKKWQMARENNAKERFVVCNADEGEPGTFKDRFLLHKHFGKVIEGMIIAGYTIASKKGYIYLRGEYVYLKNSMIEILEVYKKNSLLNENFDIEIRLGMGAYICGEETALIESLEGKRGEPRNRPPYPIDTGLNGSPTIVNNVETFYDVSLIFELGQEYFNKFGTENSRGLKLFSISGDLEKEGIYVIPYGTSLKELLNITEAKDIYAIIVGGAQGEVVKKDDFHKKLAFEALPSGGSIIFLKKNRDLLEVLSNFLEFFIEESCGQCTPCRLGIKELLTGIKDLQKGHLSINRLNKLIDLAHTIKNTSKCGLGSGSVNAFISLVENFKEDILGRVEGEKNGNF